MSHYRIRPQSLVRAKLLGVRLRPSTDPTKKIDVLDRDGHFIVAIGDIEDTDYPTLLELERQGRVGAGTAERERKAYRKRVGKVVMGSVGWYELKIFWI